MICNQYFSRLFPFYSEFVTVDLFNFLKISNGAIINIHKMRLGLGFNENNEFVIRTVYCMNFRQIFDIIVSYVQSIDMKVRMRTRSKIVQYPKISIQVCN